MKTMSPPDFSLSASDDGDSSFSGPPPAGAAVISTALEDTSADDSPKQLQSIGYTSKLSPIQKKDAPIQRKRPDPKTHLRKKVILTKRVGVEEFKRIVINRLLGGRSDHLKWTLSKKIYDPKDNPFYVWVAISLIKENRAANNKKKGVSTDQSGDISGAKKRADSFAKSKQTKSKAALIQEINRRYAEDTGLTPKDVRVWGNNASAKFWRQIRDEVLFQNEYIKKLPPKVLKLIKNSTDGKKITPRDIEQLFRIAKAIEGMDVKDVQEYYNKISGTTKDLDAFEAALQGFRTQKQDEKAADEKREIMQTRLYGQGDLYKQYTDWKSLRDNYLLTMAQPGAGLFNPLREVEQKARTALVTALRGAGYSSIADFEAYIAKFQKVFEKKAQQITLDILEKYEGTLFREGQRYQDPKAIKGLHKQLGGFRAHAKEFEKNAAISNARASYDRMPGPDFLKGSPPSSRKQARQAFKKASQAKQGAISDVKGLSAQHPLLKEDHLPLDRRLDKKKMAQSNPQALGALIQQHVAARIADVRKAKAQIAGDPELVFKLPKLMPEFYRQMGIPKGGICDQIVKAKVSQIERDEMLVNMLLAVLAIALAIVSYGTATPLIAAGAAVGGLAVSSYFVYDEYQNYTTQHDLAAVGFTDDPSMFWLIVSIGGAVLDMGVAVKAVRALAPAAKALNAGGDFAEFIAVVRNFGKAGETEAKIALAVEKAAAAKLAAKDAAGSLSHLLGTKGAIKSLVDPKAYQSLVRLASAKIRQGIHSFHHFMLEIKKARQIAKVAGDMSPEEIAKAKEAWEQAVKLHKSAEVPVDIMSGKKVIGRFSNGSHLEVVSKRAKIHGGNTIYLDPKKTTTITGTLKDTNTVASRGQRMAGATVMGSNPGGVNLLRSPKWAKIQQKHIQILEAGDKATYWRTVTEEFWSTVNKPWLDDAIKRGDNFRLISNPSDQMAIYSTTKKGKFILDKAGKKIKSIFGREVDYLLAKGYQILSDGTAISPKH